MKRNSTATIKGSTLFLRVALLGLVAFAGVITGAVLWTIYSNFNPELSGIDYVRWLTMLALVIAVAAFYVACVQAWKLLGYADKNKPFSKDSVKALKRIQYAAFVVGSMLLALLPWVYWAAQQDDAPGLVIVGTAFAMTPIVVGVFAGVLRTLIQNALDLKSENDLTV